ncbi:hypothetical protein VPH35_081997 [Triticum aestivum]
MVGPSRSSKPSEVKKIICISILAIETHFFASLFHLTTLNYIIIPQFFARRVRLKKTKTIIRYFRKYPTSITALTSRVNIFSMPSLLICGFSIFFREYAKLAYYSLIGRREITEVYMRK